MKRISIFIVSMLLMSVVACKKTESTDTETAPKEEVKEVEEVVAMEAPLNGLSTEEEKDGWILMFDGKTTDGWRGYKKDHFPEGWKIVDGTIMCAGSGRGEAGAKDGGDIIYDTVF